MRSRDGTRWLALAAEVGPACRTGYTPPATPGLVRVHDDRGATLFTCPTDASPATGALSPDGHRITLAFAQQLLPPTPADELPWHAGKPPRLEVWDAATGQVIATRDGAARWLAYHDRDTLLALDGYRLLVLDAHTLRQRHAVDLDSAPIFAAALSEDGQRLALARTTHVDVFTLTP